MIFNKEVFAVIMALVIIASVFSAAQVLRPSNIEPFIAIGLLNKECMIGYYPQKVLLGSNVTLCIFVDNHMGKTVFYKVVYKIGTSDTIPTNTSPSPEPVVKEWYGVLGNGENVTFHVLVPIKPPKNISSGRIALIFELWTYNLSSNKWVYSGRWVHLYVQLVKPSG